MSKNYISNSEFETFYNEALDPDSQMPCLLSKADCIINNYYRAFYNCGNITDEAKSESLYKIYRNVRSRFFFNDCNDNSPAHLVNWIQKIAYNTLISAINKNNNLVNELVFIDGFFENEDGDEMPRIADKALTADSAEIELIDAFISDDNMNTNISNVSEFLTNQLESSSKPYIVLATLSKFLIYANDTSYSRPKDVAIDIVSADYTLNELCDICFDIIKSHGWLQNVSYYESLMRERLDKVVAGVKVGKSRLSDFYEKGNGTTAISKWSNAQLKGIKSSRRHAA